MPCNHTAATPYDNKATAGMGMGKCCGMDMDEIMGTGRWGKPTGMRWERKNFMLRVGMGINFTMSLYGTW